MSKMLSLMVAFLLFVSIPQFASVMKFGLVKVYSASLESTTIVVPDDYTRIQEAVDAADPGDTIYVRNGTYYENIFVNKTVSLVGEDAKITIIDGSKSNATFGPVVHLFGEDAKDVRICNFTIRGSDNAWGIYITFHANTRIEKNIIVNNSGGIVADFSDNNTFVNNTIVDNKFEGILFLYSSGNIMRNNTVSGNKYNFGILESSFNHDIDTSNLVNGKPIYYLKNQSNLFINPHNFSTVGYLALINCMNITVENLKLTNNINGLLLVETKNSTVRNNTFENNSRGIDIIDSSNNTIQGNNVTDSTWLGIPLVHSPNNRFRENNLVGNQLNFKVSGDHLSDFLQDIDLSNTVNGKFMRYLINCTNLIANPSTFNNTGYLALVNCYNITVENFSLEKNELLFVFTQNSSIIENMITRGGISLTHSSFINLTGNIITNGESGISIYHSDNNTIAKNNMVQNTGHGICVQISSFNTIFDNNLESNSIGIRLSESSNNTIFGNNITENIDYGIMLLNSSYNKIFHNNFINNAIPQWQAVCSQYPLPFCLNYWDDGYPSGGNYWSDYNGTDLYSGTHPQHEIGRDGIGDAPYMINFGSKDNYPLMGTFYDFAVTAKDHVGVISNSIVSNLTLAIWLSSPTEYLQPGQEFIWFFVAGEENTTGFCRVTIPRNVVNGTYTVLVDGEEVAVNELACPNSTHAYLYFTYRHSKHDVMIIPEFPKATVLVTFITIITLVAIVKKKLDKSKVTKSRRNSVCNGFA